MKSKGKSVVGLLLLLVLCLSLCAVSVVGTDNTVAQADGETEISLTGIQMRGAINGWYYYLVLQSDGYNGLAMSEENADCKTILTSDKIKLYTSADDSGTTLTDLTVQHVDQNRTDWTDFVYQFCQVRQHPRRTPSVQSGCGKGLQTALRQGRRCGYVRG